MAAGATYEPIATTTLSSAASSITFSSIPSTYTDLRVVLVCTASTSNVDVLMRFNSDTATNYSITYLQGDGTSATSSAIANTNRIRWAIGAGASSVPNMKTADIFSYAGSTYKTLLTTEISDINGAGGNVTPAVQMWRSTSAINTILIATGSSTFATGTTATLYGIKAA